MAAFTVRVVLYKADLEDYEELYEYMNSEGFDKTITSDDGVTFQLPDAEYNYQGNISRSDVLEKAKIAARKTQKNYSVLVTESNGRSWYNLNKVQASKSSRFKK